MKLRSFATALTMLAITTSGVAMADDQPLEVQIVDALNKAFGVHPGFRANHAKGIVTEGTFKASSAAASLSKAAIFSGATIPVTVRFSDSTGIPNLPDGAADANPHGMAIKYHLPDGSETDMVINSLKFFLGGHGRRVPRPVPGDCRKSARRAQADEARRVRRGPSIRGRRFRHRGHT